MKTLILTGIIGLFYFTGEIQVYICDNGASQVYHVYQNCSAYQKCQHDTLHMSKSEAERTGLRRCRSQSGCGK